MGNKPQELNPFCECTLSPQFSEFKWKTWVKITLSPRVSFFFIFNNFTLKNDYTFTLIYICIEHTKVYNKPELGDFVMFFRPKIFFQKFEKNRPENFSWIRVGIASSNFGIFLAGVTFCTFEHMWQASGSLSTLVPPHYLTGLIKVEYSQETNCISTSTKKSIFLLKIRQQFEFFKSQLWVNHWNFMG